MNVFVLCTGRCGSLTFIKACRHITNFTSGHESRTGRVGTERLVYPANHIEADNRLSWLLGRLEKQYGETALYVHLTRNAQATARSFARRYATGIIAAYRKDILIDVAPDTDPLAVSLDYCDTVTANIESFLKDKPRVMTFALEHAKEHFRGFWSLIGAAGDLQAALAEFDTAYNASRAPEAASPLTAGRRALGRILTKLAETVRGD